jgi:rhodanese-related sulfurtransferase
MKKFLLALFSALLVVSFVGCGSDNDDKVDGNSSSQEVAKAHEEDMLKNDDNDTNTASQEEKGPFSAGEYGAITLSGKSYDDIKDEFKDAILIDVRTPEERSFYGYPEGFTNNVVYQNRDYQVVGGELKYQNKPHNDNFVNDVKNIVNNNLNKKIVLICDSSSRTGAHYDGTGEIPAKDSAAKELSNAGFTNVYHIKGGFRGDEDGDYENGWEDLFKDHIVKN